MDEENKKKPSFTDFNEYKQWLSGIKGDANPDTGGEGNNVLSDARLKQFATGLLTDDKIKRLIMMGLIDNNMANNPDMLRIYLARTFR